MGQIPTQLQAKKRAARISSIREKAERGETHGNERALIRVGKMQTRILTGQEDLSVWSKEELIRGQRRDRNGKWQGRAPVTVPKAIHDELVKRTLNEAAELLRSNLTEAVQMLVDVMKGADTEPKDKLKAIQMIMDRVLGKAPEKVEHHITGEKPWEQAMAVVFVGEEEDIGQVIDVDFTEVDEEDPFADDDDGG